MVTHHRTDGARRGWLMLVVQPMVSTVAGAFMIPHLRRGNGS